MDDREREQLVRSICRAFVVPVEFAGPHYRSTRGERRRIRWFEWTQRIRRRAPKAG